MLTFCNMVVMAVLVINSLELPASRNIDGRRGERRRNSRLYARLGLQHLRNASSPDPALASLGIMGTSVVAGSSELNFEKSIEDMVSQVTNNPALSKTKCAVDRQLWMANSRSLSPWSYRINHDENRKPVDIPEAKCSCKGCINPFTMQEDRTMTSVLIYAKIPVRRLLCDSEQMRSRKKKKCILRYRSVVESIAVGCTCIVG